MNNKVSVLVITYNQEAFIEETLLSILNQETSFNYEIIVADDCSTDLTSQIIQDIAKAYPYKIKHVRRQKNLGLIGNFFSALIDECEGEYVSICAGDDYWIDKFKLQKQSDLLDKRSDCSVVLTAYQKLYVSSNTFETITNWNSKLQKKFGSSAIKYVLFEEFTFFPVASSIMFRRDVTRGKLLSCKKLYEDSNIPGEGMLLFSIFAETGFFYFMDDVTTVYRIHTKSACHYSDYQKMYVFQIKYYMQKFEIADFFKVEIVCKYKLFLKFILTYIYAIKDNHQKEYILALESCQTISRNTLFKNGISCIKILKNRRKLCDLLLNIVNIKKNRSFQNGE